MYVDRCLCKQILSIDCIAYMFKEFWIGCNGKSTVVTDNADKCPTKKRKITKECLDNPLFKPKTTQTYRQCCADKLFRQVLSQYQDFGLITLLQFSYLFEQYCSKGDKQYWHIYGSWWRNCLPYTNFFYRLVINN